MGRTLLDRRGAEIENIPPERQEKIDKILDRLNIPRDSNVQLNVGEVEETQITPKLKWN